MSKRILIIGAGFAGMWSALAAARLLDQAGRSDVEVALIAPRRNCTYVRACTNTTPYA